MEQKFRDWTIKECVGEGAFGKVYEIEREEFGHVYRSALKVIQIPQNSSELKSALNEGMSMENAKEYFYGMVQKIVEEFSLMSKLKGNSNIVSYEDHYVEENKDGFGWTIYIRMELLTPLYQHIKEKKITVKDIIQLGIDICRALEICQRFNIIHRDIKPENMFISELGDYKLGDFGIARELEKTSSGLSKVGTKSYMAPEVFKGLEYNSTVDIYSLGIVMYRFLNRNRLPFMPPAPEVIKYSDKEKADTLRMSGQQMPNPCSADGRLAEIVLKACAYNPKDRYESAADMRKALEEILYTEKERHIAYPEGDELENSSVKYVEDSGKSKRSFRKEKSEKKEDGIYTPPVPAKEIREEPAGVSGEMPEKPGRKKLYIAGGAACILILLGAFLLKGFLGASNEEGASDNIANAISNDATEADGAQTAIEIAEVTPVVTEPPSYQLANVVNQKKEKAVAELEKQTKAKVEIKEKYSDIVKKGYVIKQSPAAGKTFYLTDDKKNYDVLEKISIVVSKGEKPVVVPNLANKSLEDAKEILTKKGLAYSVNSAVYSSAVADGHIVSQSVEAGTEVKKGKVIVLTPSKGPQPDVSRNTNQTNNNSSSRRSTSNSNSTNNTNNNSSSKKPKEDNDASLSKPDSGEMSLQ